MQREVGDERADEGKRGAGDVGDRDFHGLAGATATNDPDRGAGQVAPGRGHDTRHVAGDGCLSRRVTRRVHDEDLVAGDDVFFAATGVSSGELLKGVRYFAGGAQTQSLAMRGRSGTVRRIDSWHNFDRLDKLATLRLH